jgi:hypothetical protein
VRLVFGQDDGPQVSFAEDQHAIQELSAKGADQAFADRVHARHRAAVGSIELLVNNAAVVWPLGPSVTIDASQWATAIAINVTAAARLTFMVLPGMLAQGWGRIVNVSSGIAASPAAMLRANAYATSKAAGSSHPQPRRRTCGHRHHGQRVPPRWSRHRDAGLDPQAGPRADRRDPAPAVRRQLPAGTLLTPAQSAASLLTRLPSPASGQIWDANDPQ